MSVKAADLEAWERWRSNKSQQNLEALMTQMAPILRRATQQWGSLAPSFVLENEAKALAIKAFHTYDPNRLPPTSLNTHVTNALLKLSRTGYKNQSSLTIPEQARLTFNKYRQTKLLLEDETGVTPTHDEIADRLQLHPVKLRELVETVGRRELIESGEGPAFAKDVPDDILDLAFHDMTPIQRRVFELRTGYRGAHKAKDAAEIMKTLGITQGQLSYIRQQLERLLANAKRVGMGR